MNRYVLKWFSDILFYVVYKLYKTRISWSSDEVGYCSKTKYRKVNLLKQIKYTVFVWIFNVYNVYLVFFNDEIMFLNHTILLCDQARLSCFGNTPTLLCNYVLFV